MNYAWEAFPDFRNRNASNQAVYSRENRLSLLQSYTPPSAPHLSLFSYKSAVSLPRFDKPRAYEDYRNQLEDFFHSYSQSGVDIQVDRNLVLGLLDDLSDIRTKEELYEIIAHYERLWKDQHFIKGGIAGQISGNTLSIARHSTEFWTSNPEAIHHLHPRAKNQKVWWFVVGMVVRNDVIGGMAGILASQAAEAVATGTWGGNDGVVTGEETAAAFLGGAVTGSLGL
jgi:hypothetical protein